jgi:hypothetical protein
LYSSQWSAITLCSNHYFRLRGITPEGNMLSTCQSTMRIMHTCQSQFRCLPELWHQSTFTSSNTWARNPPLLPNCPRLYLPQLPAQLRRRPSIHQPLLCLSSLDTWRGALKPAHRFELHPALMPHLSGFHCDADHR